MPSLETPEGMVLCRAVEKIALELVLAEAGKDNGLLPVNSLVGELESAVSTAPVPQPMSEALRQGRDWVDAALMSGGFTEESLQRLRAWVEWMQGAINALHSGTPMPPLLSGEDAESSGASPGFGQPTDTSPGVASDAAGEATAGDAGPEEPLILNLAGDADLLREFTNESHEHLQNIELGVLTLEENPTDSGTLNSIFRAFHTFKGGSGFLNLRPINHLAHELESLLDLARQSKLSIDSHIINLILAGGDTLNRFVAEIEAQLGGTRAGESIIVPTRALLQQVRGVIETCGASGESATKPAPAAALAVTARAEDPVVRHAPEPGAASSPMSERVEATGAAPGLEVRPGGGSPPSAVPVESGANPAARAVQGGATAVKVDTHKLDSLVDLVGEMVIAQSIVMQDSDLLGLRSQHLSRNLAQLGRITKELQRVAMSLRMVPIRSTFQKMTRLVRDLSIKAGRQVELQMSGEDTELDRTIVEEISDPLVHMIRNAVDHGIEHPDKRLASGKSPHGVIHLRAFHQGGNIVVEVEDDGAGLNRDRILKKAVDKGLLPAGVQLSDAQIFDLIFAPGFSTAEKVTDISGRGVGMDVVRRNIEKLRGKIEIQSTLGKGSRFTIYLPLTLAIIDGMIVGVGPQRYIVPTLAVRESFRPTPDMVSSVQGRAEVINVRGHLLPLVRLHQLFGIEARALDPTQGIVIVIESDRESRCLLVDDLLGKQEVVIKSLGDTFKQSVSLAGAAILGDGRVGLILDVDALVGPRAGQLALAA